MDEKLIQELINTINELKEQNKQLLETNGNLFVIIRNLRDDLAKKQ